MGAPVFADLREGDASHAFDDHAIDGEKKGHETAREKYRVVKQR